MLNVPFVFPLANDGRICAIKDENGEIVGTGSREVCEILLHIITKGMAPLKPSRDRYTKQLYASNIRSAIVI